MNKKLKIILFVASAMLFITLIGCDDSGAQGADFDSSSYYTKTEVDAAINAAVDLAVSQAATAAEIAYLWNSGGDHIDYDLIGAEWAGRTGPWTVPNEAVLGIFFVKAPGIDVISADGYGYLRFGDSEAEAGLNFALKITSGQETTIVVPVDSGEELYAWIDDPITPTSVDPVIIKNIGWIK